MATRNITPMFVEARSVVNAHQLPSTLPPLHVDEKEKFDDIMRGISRDISTINLMKRAVNIFDNDEIRLTNDKINAMSLNARFNTAKGIIEKINTLDFDINEKRNVIQYCRMIFQKQFEQYSKSVSTYVQYVDADDENDRKAGEQDIYMQMEDGVGVQSVNRTNAINSIVKSVQDIHNMFIELNSMIIEQGTILDRIDYQVDNALVNVKKGTHDIEKAYGYTSKVSKSLVCIGLLFLIVVGLSVGLYVKHR